MLPLISFMILGMTSSLFPCVQNEKIVLVDVNNIHNANRFFIWILSLRVRRKPQDKMQ